jgi:hypothetical protein
MGALALSRNRVIVPARQATYAGGIDTLGLIPGLHKRLKIRAQVKAWTGITVWQFLCKADAEVTVSPVSWSNLE